MRARHRKRDGQALGQEDRQGSEHAQRIRVLELDPELGAGIEAAKLDEARRRCTAGLLRMRRGRVDSWLPPRGADRDRVWILVLDGLLACRLSIESRHAAELLGPGDLFRPWAFGTEVTIRAETRWRVHEPTLLAVLDERFFESAARWPSVPSALIERSARRARSMLVRLAIAELPVVIDRVHLVLWHLADRWGRVSPSGVVLQLRLSQTTLADLVCAQRETVSRALAILAQQDLVHRHERGYRLRGDSPADLRSAEEAKNVIALTALYY